MVTEGLGLSLASSPVFKCPRHWEIYRARWNVYLHLYTLHPLSFCSFSFLAFFFFYCVFFTFPLSFPFNFSMSCIFIMYLPLRYIFLYSFFHFPLLSPSLTSPSPFCIFPSFLFNIFFLVCTSFLLSIFPLLRLLPCLYRSLHLLFLSRSLHSLSPVSACHSLLPALLPRLLTEVSPCCFCYFLTLSLLLVSFFERGGNISFVSVSLIHCSPVLVYIMYHYD